MSKMKSLEILDRNRNWNTILTRTERSWETVTVGKEGVRERN